MPSTQPWKEENYHKIEKILNNFKNLKITYSGAIGDIQNIISSERAKLLKEIEEKNKEPQRGFCPHCTCPCLECEMCGK